MKKGIKNPDAGYYYYAQQRNENQQKKTHRKTRTSKDVPLYIENVRDQYSIHARQTYYYNIDI